MRSFRLRLALWFALSLAVISGVFMAVTFLRLDHELRQERWEREQPGHADWVLHGSYSKSEVADIMGELVRISLVYAVPLLGLAAVSGFHLARRSLQPIAAINAQLSGIGAQNLDHRLALPHADREFAAVEKNVNALLERLEQSFHQLNVFAAQVAHDLRTPLTLMRLQVEEAADKIEPSVAEGLQEELSRLSDYVDQCLLLARAEQGRVALHATAIDLSATLREMIETYELLAREEQRALTIKADGPCVLRADPTYLRQILHNLLTNALKHGRGPITITVQCEDRTTTCRIINLIRLGAGERPTGLGLGTRIVRALAALHPGFTVDTRIEADRYVAEIRAPMSSAAE